jgi:hypothetical protein
MAQVWHWLRGWERARDRGERVGGLYRNVWNWQPCRAKKTRLWVHTKRARVCNKTGAQFNTFVFFFFSFAFSTKFSVIMAV